MPRKYIKKTDRAYIDENKIKLAIAEVLEKSSSLGKAAQLYGLKKSTLQSRVEKIRKKNAAPDIPPKKTTTSKYAACQVFSEEEEKHLAKYIITCSKMLHGLSLKATRRLAYEYACAIPDAKYPSTWETNQLAGLDWLQGFRTRNTMISLRTPERTSASRAFAFNEHNISEFFNNYESVLQRYNLGPQQIFNFDETGVTTVLDTPKVLADRTQKQVGQIVSAERGYLITMGFAICAIGTFIPPVYIFPRAKYNPSFINGAPEGSLGLVSKTGWINGELFVCVLKHIQKYTRSSKDYNILLIMDNHESHITIEAINYARENGIIFLTLPPHTSHKTQPLDVSVFSPFKDKCKIAFNDWHLTHPGRTITIYDIAGLSKTAFTESFNCRNIMSGFQKTGIWPFNRMVFSSEDFLSSYVTDRPNPTATTSEESNVQMEFEEIQLPDEHTPSSQNAEPSMPQQSQSKTQHSGQITPPHQLMTPSESNEPTASTSGVQLVEQQNISTTEFVLPEHIRPYPKAGQRKKSARGRQPGKSRIFTDTPEKNRIAEIHENKIAKLEKQKARQEKQKENKLTKNKKTSKKKTVPAPIFSSSSDDNSLHLSSDEEDSQDAFDITSDGLECEDEDPAVEPSHIQEGGFVIIKFEKKTNIVFYVAEVLAKYDSVEYRLSYLRKKPGCYKFFYPAVADEACIHAQDIVKVLSPVTETGTKRMLGLIKFKESLSKYNFI